MADNTRLDSGAGGDLLHTKELTVAGTTVKVPGTVLALIAGTTFQDYLGTTPPAGWFHSADRIYYAGAVYTVKHAVVSLTATGDAIAAVATKALVVVGGHLVNINVAVNTLQIGSGATPTALSGVMDLAADGGNIHLEFGAVHFITTVSEALRFVIGSDGIRGWLKYIEV